eukprot:COSAG01_NODE_3393_length_6149_cov_24.742149_8_plen_66_part_00
MSGGVSATASVLIMKCGQMCRRAIRRDAKVAAGRVSAPPTPAIALPQPRRLNQTAIIATLLRRRA